MPSSDSIASMVVEAVEVVDVWGASRPFWASCSSASTGSSSVGGRGKGGVRVGEGQDQEVPGKREMNAISVDWSRRRCVYIVCVFTEGNEELPREETPLDDGDI